MLKLILLAWVLGIATMGKSYPMLVNMLPVLLLCAVAVWGWNRLRSHSTSFHLLQVMQGLLFAVSAFALGHHYADQALSERLQFRESQPGPVEAIVYVKSINQLTANGAQQKVEVLGRHVQAVDWLLYLQSSSQQPLQPLQLGQYYRIGGVLKPAHAYAIPGAFDQEKWWLQQGIMAGVRLQELQPLTADEVTRLGFATHVRQQQQWIRQMHLSIERLRLDCREFLQRQPLQHKGLLLGLLTGDNSLLSEQTEEQFKRFGISHLLAISGPHVLIFAGLVSWILHLLIRRYWPEVYLTWPKPYLLIGPFILCVLLYCAFVGFEIPALRTLLISLIGAVVILLQQPIRVLGVLLFSAALLLYLDPFSILSAAFWLSYGACLILLRIYQTFQQQMLPAQHSWLQRIYPAVKLLAESQGKIFIALIPLVLVFFQQLAWIAPITNMIAIPFLGMLIVPLDIVSACLYLMFEPVGALGFQLADVLLNFFMALLDALDVLFQPELYAVAMTPLMIIGMTLGIVILFLPRGLCPKAWSAVFIVPVMLGATQQPTFDLSVLDVGQGQSILIRDDQHTVMIDTGGYYDERKFSIGQQVVVPYLLRNGVSEIDQLFLSHLDQDHSGALPAIARNIDIQQVFANEKLMDNPAKKFHYCHAGQKWQLRHSTVQVLFPEPSALYGVSRNRNEHSCVLYVQVPLANGRRNFLIMGDAGWEAEYQLLQRYPDLKVDVLVLGHHGSRHSSAYDFLQRLRPKLVIASAGWQNRYGHPSKEVRARLQDLHIPLLSTPESGTIRFQLQQDGTMQMQSYRQQWRWLKIEPSAGSVAAAGF